FEDLIPRWIQKLPRVQKDWNALLQTLEGHIGSVNAVTFSPNGTVVASASLDRTISYGTHSQDRSARHARGIRTPSIPLHSHQTAQSWPRHQPIEPSSCGTYNQDRSVRCSKGIQASLMPPLSLQMAPS